MGTYAERTTVTPERRRAEIERTLARFGATRLGEKHANEAEGKAARE